MIWLPDTGQRLPIASAYALYYLVGDQTHAPVSALHWVLGLALAPILMVHIVAGHRGDATDVGIERRSGTSRRGAE